MPPKDVRLVNMNHCIGYLAQTSQTITSLNASAATVVAGDTATGRVALLEQMFLTALSDPSQPAIVVVDAFGDLFMRLLGDIPDTQLHRVRIMDISSADFAYGLNPFDVLSNGLDQESAVQLFLESAKPFWAEKWTPDVQLLLKRTAQTLVAANSKTSFMSRMNIEKPLGVASIGAFLKASPWTRKRFIDGKLRDHPLRTMLLMYFAEDFDVMPRAAREDLVNQVLLKTAFFEESPIVEFCSGGESNLSPKNVLLNNSILLVNLSRSFSSKQGVNFIGSIVLNSLTEYLFAQSSPNKKTATFIVDGIETLESVSWSDLILRIRSVPGSRSILGVQTLAEMLPGGRLTSLAQNAFNFFCFSTKGKNAILAMELLNQENKSFNRVITPEIERQPPDCAFVRLVDEDGSFMVPESFRVVKATPDKKMRQYVVAASRQYSIPRDHAKKIGAFQAKSFEASSVNLLLRLVK